MKNSKQAFKAVLAVLTVLATGSACAQSMTNQGFYGEVGYLPLQLKNSNNGFDATSKLVRLTVGKEINQNLSVESLYGFTVSEGTSVINNITYHANASAYGVLLKPKVEFAKGVEAFARIGAIHTKYEDEGMTISKTKAAYGLGIQAQFSKDIHGQFDYMRYYKQDGLTARGFTASIGVGF